MLRQRFRKGGPAFDRLRRLAENLLDRGIARLLLQRVQRTDQRQPRTQQNRQLTGHHRQILAFDHRRAEADVHQRTAALLLAGAVRGLLLGGKHGRLDRSGKQSLALEFDCRRFLGIGVDLALLFSAVSVHRGVEILRHDAFSNWVLLQRRLSRRFSIRCNEQPRPRSIHD